MRTCVNKLRVYKAKIRRMSNSSLRLSDCNPGIPNPGRFFNPEIPGLSSAIASDCNPGILKSRNPGIQDGFSIPKSRGLQSLSRLSVSTKNMHERRHWLTMMDLQRRSCMAGDQNVIRPSWLQQTNAPSGGVSRIRSTGSRCGVGCDLAGNWKPMWRARRYESSISPYSSCMYVQNSSHVMLPWVVQSIFSNNVSTWRSFNTSQLGL